MTEDRNITVLKADADDQIHPPSTGWQFFNGYTNKFEEDLSMTCSPAPPSCSVTLRLSGLARDFQGNCEGEYKDSGLRSAGRQVPLSSIKSFPPLKQCKDCKIALTGQRNVLLVMAQHQMWWNLRNAFELPI